MVRWLAALLLLFSVRLYSAEWYSPVVALYQERNSELFEQYEQARELNDAWRGEGAYLDEARRILDSIVQSDNRFAPAYFEIGRLEIMDGYINNTKFSEGSLEAAEAAILKAIELEPDYAEAHALLGHLYTRSGNYEAARSSLEKAEFIGTKSPWLNINWGDLLVRVGEHEAAFDRYMQVIEDGTDNRKAYSSALTGVQRYYEQAGELDLADEWYRKELEYEPESAWSWGNYAAFQLYSLGDEDGAIASAETALGIMDYGMGRMTLACALYTKWARLMDEGSSGNEAAQYFSRAYQSYKNIDRAAMTLNSYEPTRFAGERLAAAMQALREQKKRQGKKQ